MAQTRAERSRQLRYKKGIAAGFNLAAITEDLNEIGTECDDIRYIAEGDESALIDALDGNDEEAYEFRMMFSDLSSECEELGRLLSEEYVTEHFDDFFCRVAGGCTSVLGYDAYEDDYYTLTSFESQLSQSESGGRLMKLTKHQILQSAEQCFGIAAAYLNVRYKYDYLKATFDILRDENTSFLAMIKDIESAYEQAESDKFGEYDKSNKAFEKLIAALPPRTWLE